MKTAGYLMPVAISLVLLAPQHLLGAPITMNFGPNQLNPDFFADEYFINPDPTITQAARARAESIRL